MNESEHSTARDFDPDAAPDLSRDGWPEKLAEVPVRRGRPPLAKPKVSTTRVVHATLRWLRGRVLS